MRDFTLKGIVKMYEKANDQEKEIVEEKHLLRRILYEHLWFDMEDGERFKISNTYFNKDTKKQVGGTIRYVGGR
jgi:hypothetical protein